MENRHYTAEAKPLPKSPAQALVELARSRAADLPEKRADGLLALADEYEAAESLSCMPVEVLMDKPKRYRDQVRQRVEHWAERAAGLKPRLQKAVDAARKGSE